eukprot:gene12157-4243_t
MAEAAGAAKKFDFTKIGDRGCGVLYWLGTRKGVAEYANPSATGEVEVCMSSVGEGQQSMIVDPTFADQ